MSGVKRAAQLLMQSLAAPSALGIRAWVLVAPLVIIDAAVAEVIFGEPITITRIPAWLGYALLMYALSGLWYLAARLIIRGLHRTVLRAGVTALALAGAGATWLSGIFVLGSGTLPDAQVALLGLAFAGAGIQIVAGSLIALVLYAQTRARQALAAGEAERVACHTADTTLVQALLDAQREFQAWVVNYLRPGIQRLMLHVHVDGASRAVTEIDAFRESVVRMTSRRLHPRIADLGAGPALTSVLRARGLDAARVEVDPQAASLLTRDQIDTAARCLDLLIEAESKNTSLLVTLELDQGRGACVLVVADSHSQSRVSAPEFSARVRFSGAHASIDRWGTIRVIFGGDDHGVPAPVDPGAVSVAPIAAAAMAVMTASVMFTIDGRWWVAAITAATASAVGVWWTLLKLPTVLRIAFAAVLTSVGVTVAWWLTTPPSDQALTGFFFANTLVVALAVGVAVMIRNLISLWAQQVTAQSELAESLRISCGQTARSIDELRGAVAHILHSQVQGRLVVAAGNLEHVPPNESSALHALDLILNEDIPALEFVMSGQIPHADLTHVIARMCARDDVRVDFLGHERGALLPHQELHVGHIMEEAISNAVRHGGATTVTIELEVDGPHVSIVISDDGTGILGDPTPGLGLSSIAAATSGMWELRNAETGGAVLTARLGADLVAQ